jgi:hypothetical protein
MIARRLIFPAALFVATAMCVLAGPATGQERNKQIADSASAAAVPASSPSDEARCGLTVRKGSARIAGVAINRRINFRRG